MGDGRGRWPLGRGAVGVAALAALLVLGGLLPVAAQQRAEVKPRFKDTLVATTFEFQTDLAWVGKDLLIATLPGIVYRLPAAKVGGTPEPILDISAVIGRGREQGLLGLAVDPQFGQNRSIYVYYTRDEGAGPNDGCNEADFQNPVADPDRCFNRLSRFTVMRDGRVNRASERPIIPYIAAGIPNHNSGDLAFGNDGMLYVSVGDGGIDAPPGPKRAQQLNNLHGKILRIRRDGAVPEDNPFAGRNGVQCGKAKPATAPKGKRCGEIYAFGLRNPYRFAVDPDAKGVRIFANDVGEDSWEEINEIEPGANYGWPRREGPCKYVPTAEDEQTRGCAGTNPKKFEPPIQAYAHDTGCSSITGGAFVPDTSNWGNAYRDAYIFGDFICSKIVALTPKDGGKGYTRAAFADGEMFAQTAMLFDPTGKILYYTQNGGGPNGENEIRAVQRK